MKVILEQKLYGYCPGLKSSIEIANELANTAKQEKCKVYCDVPLAHNAQVTAKLHKKGILLVEHIGQIKPKNDYFLVSAHGASDEKKIELTNRGFRVIDGVCPRVKSVKIQAIKDFDDGYEIIIFGLPDHAEVVGINGSIQNQALILKTLKDAESVKLTKKTSVISQTTYPADQFDQVYAILQKNNPKLELVQRKTICPVVKNRVEAVIKCVKENNIDKAVVVGSPTSSNTKLIAQEVAKIIPTTMIADSRSIHSQDIENCKSILVVSGTSAPPEIVEKVADKIRSFV